MTKAKKKTCFVISPIGSEGSDIRKRADCAFEYIIKPAFKELSYEEPVRIDKEDNPSQITTSIINHLLNADMVVADLTDNNPNVFYELGIRHTQSMPVVQITQDVSSLPFDASGQNTIEYVHDDPSSHLRAIQRVVDQVNKMDKPGAKVSNPVTQAVGYQKMVTSGDSEQVIISNLAHQLEKMQIKLDRMSDTLNIGVGPTILNENFTKQAGYGSKSVTKTLLENIVTPHRKRLIKCGNCHFVTTEDDSNCGRCGEPIASNH